jgi:hypothetical protein
MTIGVAEPTPRPNGGGSSLLKVVSATPLSRPQRPWGQYATPKLAMGVAQLNGECPTTFILLKSVARVTSIFFFKKKYIFFLVFLFFFKYFMFFNI